MKQIFENAKRASRELALLTDETRNAVLHKVAGAIAAHRQELLEANARDLARMEPENPLYDRLLLTESRLEGIASDIRHVAALPSPLERVTKERTLENGLHLCRISVPFGVIGVTVATSVSVAVCAVLNTLSAHRRHKELSLRPLMKYLPYLLAGVALCCGVAVAGCRLLSGCGSLARFGIICLVGFAVYLIPTAPVLVPYVRTLMKAGSEKKE